ncbi:MAG: ATP-binding protein, partial [Muribaculaceae bacterium]|nr:ATP-binding protein [Muribaculaceae bacterium]
APKRRQLERFAMALQSYGYGQMPQLSSWYQAFDALQELLQMQPQKTKKVIFLDEMPWIAGSDSEFVSALEDFWNAWAMLRSDIFLLGCGSSTSWMVDHLIENQGGLHGRITARIYLRPFSLGETEQFLLSKGCEWDRYQILQCYMCFGGVPFYLNLLDTSLSLAQNIDRLYLNPGAVLHSEFSELYGALFGGKEVYADVVRFLAKHHSGCTRQEILQNVNCQGGTLTKVLANLANSDFIVGYNHYGNKKKGIIYRLTDMFTLFYFRFIEAHSVLDTDVWQRNLDSPQVRTWQGLCFEIVAMHHVEQIKRALGLTVVSTKSSTWRSFGNGALPGTQIDLVIERADRIIHLCELKFALEPYVITADYEQKLRNRMALFRAETKTRKTLVTTFVTTYGVTPGRHSGIVHSQVTLDDLFVLL